MPGRIEAGDIHSIRAFRGNYTACRVPKTRGLLHHYRVRVPGFLAKYHKPQEAGYVSDHYLLRFAPQIVSRVAKVLEDIGSFGSS